jgi:hypothetical protein
MCLWTECSFEPNAQPQYRAPRDHDLNSIPKWCDTPMARGSRLQRGTIGNRSEAIRCNFVETSWQLRSEWSRMWKPLKFWTLEVCVLCSTRVLRVTRISRRARHTLFCWCFCRISPTFRLSAKNHWAPPDFVAATEFCKSSKNIDLRAVYSYVSGSGTRQLYDAISFTF